MGQSPFLGEERGVCQTGGNRPLQEYTVMVGMHFFLSSSPSSMILPFLWEVKLSFQKY